MLLAALQNSRRTLHSLEASQKALGDSIAREKKQFERLHFWCAPDPHCTCPSLCAAGKPCYIS